MSHLLSCRSVTKSFSSRPLFENISFSVADGERVGMIGPNGSGKSTLLKILSGEEHADSGDVVRNKSLHLAYVPQNRSYEGNTTIGEVLEHALADQPISDEERHARVGQARSTVGLPDTDTLVKTLSGGWVKRLSIAEQLIRSPDLLLLDEPTNHLDLDGILWLERFLMNAPFAVLVVSHDRIFLERITTRILEINRTYPLGSFSVEGNYSRFLEKREEFLTGIERYEEGLRNKVRRETEWLRRGAKARSTKQQARIKGANKMIDELGEYQARSRIKSDADIDFAASGRKTKNLLTVEGISKRLGDRQLFADLTFVLSPGVRLGIIGANGSGKTTLLNTLVGKLEPDSGTIVRAPNLTMAQFDQTRSQLNKTGSLKRALAPEGDSVVYRDSAIHVASWAKRFLFRPEQLEMPVSSLSGGEQARVLIANLMLTKADLLILDEPTNDLDIETLQVLEDSLEDFPGAIVLVTHDRYMLDRVSTILVGLDGEGGATMFAEYAQWEDFRKNRRPDKSTTTSQDKSTPTKKSKRLSYKEQQEWDHMEGEIQKAEHAVERWQTELTDPAVGRDSERLKTACDSLQAAKEKVEALYHRWSELEQKRS